MNMTQRHVAATKSCAAQTFRHTSMPETICLPESCLSHDVTRTLCYWQQHMPLCEEYILTNNLTARSHCDLSLHHWLRFATFLVFVFYFHFKPISFDVLTSFLVLTRVIDIIHRSVLFGWCIIKKNQVHIY